MIKSMTGFGKSSASLGSLNLQIDIRALNSRQLDLNLRIPASYREKEAEIRSEVTRIVERGKVDVFISLKQNGAGVTSGINKELLKARYTELAALAGELGADNEQLFPALVGLSDVFNEQEGEISEEDWKTVSGAFQQALAQLDGFRSDEGKGLYTELKLRVVNIQELLHAVNPLEESRMTAVKSRLRTKLDEIARQVQVDAGRFEEELIYYLEKLDITEEKQRLETHCRYFLETMDEAAATGRKLGFIAQEMGREINTIGSKANLAELQKIVVLMKDELEKIKEQLNNVL